MKGMIQMRDKNQSFIQFCKSVEEVVNRKLQLSRMLRTTVVNSPTFPSELKFVYPKKLVGIRGLVIVHWFLPENLMYLIHSDLWEMSFSHFNDKQKLEIAILLSSKENCLKYLYLTERYSMHEIFGNLLDTGIKSSNNLKCYFVTYNKPELPQRKRGYDDKGSLRPRDKWLPTHDYTLTQIQNEKELRIHLTLKSLNHIKKFLENYVISE